MDIQNINDKYGRLIWKIAYRYSTGIWAAEDVFNQLLLDVYVAMQNNYLNTEQRVVSFIITRAINIVRKEKRRKFVVFSAFEVDGESTLQIAAKCSKEESEFEMRLLFEFVQSVLGDRMAEFVMELAFPSINTIRIASQDVSGGVATKILPRHVSKSLYGYEMSGASLSQMLSSIRQSLSGYYNVREEFADVVNKILAESE